MSAFLECLVNTALLASALCPNQCTTMQKSMHGDLRCFTHVASHQEEKEGADPNLPPVLLSQWLTWARWEPSCPETLVLILIRLCWREAANDDKNLSCSLLVSDRQSLECANNEKNSLQHLWFSLSEIKSSAVAWKALCETHLQADEVWILAVVKRRDGETASPSTMSPLYRCWGSTSKPQHALSVAAQTCSRHQEVVIFATSQLTGS